MLPKKIRIVVLVDGIGRLTARTIAQYINVTRADDTRKGFRELVRMNIPIRRLKSGWGPYYAFAARRLVHLYGL